MKTNNILDLRRLYYLVRRQILSSSKIWLIGFGAVAGSLLLITLLSALPQPAETRDLSGLYYVVLFLGGYVFTSQVFSELHTPQRSIQFLSLPVSTTERLLSAWLITAVIFPLAAVLGMALVVLLANLISLLAFGVGPFEQVFHEASWTVVKVYVVTQSVFLLGAAYFRKNNFLKTVLALFVISMAFQLVIVASAGLILSPLSDGAGFQMQAQHLTPNLEALVLQYIPNAAKILFWYLWTPFFLVTTWFSLKEREV